MHRTSTGRVPASHGAGTAPSPRATGNNIEDRDDDDNNTSRCQHAAFGAAVLLTAVTRRSELAQLSAEVEVCGCATTSASWIRAGMARLARSSPWRRSPTHHRPITALTRAGRCRHGLESRRRAQGRALTSWPRRLKTSSALFRIALAGLSYRDLLHNLNSAGLPPIRLSRRPS